MAVTATGSILLEGVVTVDDNLDANLKADLDALFARVGIDSSAVTVHTD